MNGLELAPPIWPAVASQLGFAPGPAGTRERNGTRLRPEGRWLGCLRPARIEGDPLAVALRAPGLWRLQREGASWVWSHDLPPVAASEEIAADPGSGLAGLVAWAEATSECLVAPRARFAPRDAAPSDAELETWIPVSMRSARAGADVFFVEIERDAGRFALAIPALVRLPDGLSAARLAWLRELCRDAQATWRLVRFGIDAGPAREYGQRSDEGGASVRVEVDLSGVPTPLARPLVQLALAALTSSAAWALPALALATDLSVASRILDRKPRGAKPRHQHEGEAE